MLQNTHYIERGKIIRYVNNKKKNCEIPAIIVELFLLAHSTLAHYIHISCNQALLFIVIGNKLIDNREIISKIKRN